MVFIVYDLEFNQKDKTYTDTEDTKNINLPFEIIQIGAIKLNENLETLSRFNTLIKPTLYKTVHPYVEGLTKITTKDLNSSPNFLKAFDSFRKFIDNDNAVLCVWGQADIKVLMENLIFHNISTSLLPNKFIDIQLHASKFFKAPSGSRIGLRNAIELLNISTDNNFHNALNDAIYTSEVFKHIYNKSIKIQNYTYNRKSLPENKSKEKIDFNGLITQLEKMYNKKMTPEEKELIKLSYFMGKTKQFIK